MDLVKEFLTSAAEHFIHHKRKILSCEFGIQICKNKTKQKRNHSTFYIPTPLNVTLYKAKQKKNPTDKKNMYLFLNIFFSVIKCIPRPWNQRLIGWKVSIKNIFLI